MTNSLKRCGWVSQDELYIDYHDREWGVPLYDDNQLFEFLILEGMQAGLSWLTILKKRTAFRHAFDEFEPEKIARYSDKKIEKLMANDGIIRNQLKIEASIKNAKAYLAIEKQYKTFSDFIWQFVDGQPIQNQWRRDQDVPTSSEISDRMSKELKKHGFSFVGTTICYAFMQAVGMVNDHTLQCFRHQHVKEYVCQL